MPNYFGCWKNGFLKVNGVDLSDHVREMNLEISVAELPADTHSDTATKVVAGLENWQFTVNFLQDFAAGKVDATLRGSGLGTAGHSPFPIECAADAGASISSTNPRYSGLVILSAYKPFGGPHGGNLESACTFKCAGNLARQTS